MDNIQTVTPNPITSNLTIDVRPFEEIERHLAKVDPEKPYFLPHNSIQLIWQGEFHYEADFEPHCAVAPCLVFMPADKIYRMDLQRQWRSIALRFRPEFYPNNANPLPRELPLQAEQAQWVQVYLQQMAEINRLFGDETARLTALRTMLACLFQLLEQAQVQPPAANQSPSLQLVQQFEQLLAAQCHAQHHTPHYAAQLHCAERTLNRACHKWRNKTAKAIINQQLIIQAKRLLAYQEQPIFQLAEQLGFSEPTNFVRFFKRETGITPHAFRRKIQRF